MALSTRYWPRIFSVVGISFLLLGALPFALLSMIWLIFVVGSVVFSSSWDLQLFLLMAELCVQMTFFWFGAYQVAACLFSAFRRVRTPLPVRQLVLGTIALYIACLTIYSFGQHDPKLPFPIYLILLPLFAPPFAFLPPPRKR